MPKPFIFIFVLGAANMFSFWFMLNHGYSTLDEHWFVLPALLATLFTLIADVVIFMEGVFRIVKFLDNE